MDILEYNRQAWNRESLNDGEWSVPVSEEIISAARNGAWQVVLTPLKPVPKSWFGNLHGKKVLCLASGGGQQAPVLAAAGAIVVSFDLSDVQLEKDRMLAKRGPKRHLPAMLLAGVTTRQDANAAMHRQSDNPRVVTAR
jgi:2-polyprenyl-3-methyl-5-hydroxy-6-metoxy-1,4-benzoquinol methylase